MAAHRAGRRGPHDSRARTGGRDDQRRVRRSRSAALDAVGQAELVRRGEVSPVELVTWAIERIEQLNPTLNAVVTPMFDQALAEAAAGPAGPFAGVPYLLKDLATEAAGVRFTEGSAFLRDYVSSYDSELVRRLQPGRADDRRQDQHTRVRHGADL